MIVEVNRPVSAESSSEFQSLGITVHRSDMLYTHGPQHRYANESYRTAALDDHAAVKTKYPCSFCTFHRMHQHCTRLYQHSAVQIQVTHIKHCRSFSDEDVI